MRTLISFLVVLFLVSTLNIKTSNAQDAPQLIRTLTGHPDRVVSVAFSPDGNTLASASDQSPRGDMRLWDPHTGTLRNTIKSELIGVSAIAFSPNGTTIASVPPGYNTVYLRDANTGALRNTLRGNAGGYRNVAFSPNGNIIAAGRRGEIDLWDVPTGNLLDPLILTEQTTWVHGVAFSSDSTTLASANADGTVQLWDVNTGTLRNTLRGHTKWVSSVAYSPDGNTIASGSTDKTVRLWDAHTGSLEYTLTEHTNWVYSVAFSPDSATLASAGDLTVRLWDVETGTHQHTLEHPNEVYSVAFSPDGTMLASGFEDATVVVDQGDNIALWRLTPTSAPPLTLSPNTFADQTFIVGTSVSLTLPTATGGTAPYTYTLSPIPAGLQFDPVDRWLSGTPTTTGVISVTYTATDTTGTSASLTFTITVRSIPSPEGMYVYWTDPPTHKVQRANLDGTNLEDFITAGVNRPWDLATHLSGDKIYWTSEDKIQRANLDGTNLEDLVNDRAGDIELDLSGGKMYWANGRSGKIRRANLDGSNVEDIMTNLNAGLDGLALDISGGKVYWTEWNTNSIRRANLDGSNVEVLVTGISGPACVKLNVAGGKMYLVDHISGKIQRADLNGSNLEDLVTDLNRPADLELDMSGRKMYWTAPGAGKIQRADLNGSNLEDLVTDLNAPTGIALSIPQAIDGLRFSPNVIADQTFVVNTPIAQLSLPVATGGTEPYTYTLDPLPNRLVFDPAAQVLSGTPTTEGTTTLTYTATDAIGAFASLTFTITVTSDGTLNLDVNGDGQVNVLDLILVAVFYGTRGDSLPADVNADGVVNVDDFAAVAAGVDAAGTLPLQAVQAALLAAAAQAGDIEAIAGAPVTFDATHHAWSRQVAYHNVVAALADVRHLAANDVRLGKGVALLSELLHLLKEMNAIPETTALLPNYPNPFNPETWIPYHLATDAEVTLTIYDVRGDLVRTLMFGHQPAGVYESRGRAAYWDGRNQLGEPVASGVYFYTLTAGEFTATRKLLIAK